MSRRSPFQNEKENSFADSTPSRTPPAFSVAPDTATKARLPPSAVSSVATAGASAEERIAGARACCIHAGATCLKLWWTMVLIYCETVSVCHLGHLWVASPAVIAEAADRVARMQREAEAKIARAHEQGSARVAEARRLAAEQVAELEQSFAERQREIAAEHALAAKLAATKLAEAQGVATEAIGFAE